MRSTASLLMLSVMLLFLIGCSTTADEAERPSPISPIQTPAVETLPAETAGTVYTVAVEESRVVWTGSKPIGESHTGTVDIAAGSLVLENGQLVRGTFTLDMTTITNTNLRAGQANMLENHLKSDDFFDVAAHPTAYLEILSANPLGENRYSVVAELSIKEVTQPLEFVAEATLNGDQLTAQASFSVDRSLYDIRYGSGSFFSDLGDDLIDDMIQFDVELKAAG